ncbi:MAG: peptide deformylase [Verrucomicrobia bacterium]|nr:peptide deformylase [Verrucomicrobiota bacterium]
MKYPVRIYGDPVLRAKSEPVEEVTEDIRQLAKDMLETMYAERGIGLAAQQIGKTISIFVIDIPAEGDIGEDGERLHPDIEMPLAFINPKVTAATEEELSGEEGCLSFPEISAPITRPAEVDVEFIDQNGQKRGFHAKGLLARAIQHELDHLNGVLFIDRMSHVKKIALSGRLKRMRKQTKADLGLA